MPYGLRRISLIVGALAMLVMSFVLRAGGVVGGVAVGTAMAGGATVTAVTDLIVAGRTLTDRKVLGRVAVAVTCPLAVAVARIGPPWPPVVTGGLVFAVGVGAGALAVALRRRWRPGVSPGTPSE